LPGPAPFPLPTPPPRALFATCGLTPGTTGGPLPAPVLPPAYRLAAAARPAVVMPHCVTTCVCRSTAAYRTYSTQFLVVGSISPRHLPVLLAICSATAARARYTSHRWPFPDYLPGCYYPFHPPHSRSAYRHRTLPVPHHHYRRRVGRRCMPLPYRTCQKHRRTLNGLDICGRLA